MYIYRRYTAEIQTYQKLQDPLTRYLGLEHSLSRWEWKRDHYFGVHLLNQGYSICHTLIPSRFSPSCFTSFLTWLQIWICCWVIFNQFLFLFNWKMLNSKKSIIPQMWWTLYSLPIWEKKPANASSFSRLKLMALAQLLPHSIIVPGFKT